jgi:uncharacterized ParB-like nuclease family protein
MNLVDVVDYAARAGKDERRACLPRAAVGPVAAGEEELFDVFRQEVEGEVLGFRAVSGAHRSADDSGERQPAR